MRVKLIEGIEATMNSFWIDCTIIVILIVIAYVES